MGFKTANDEARASQPPAFVSCYPPSLSKYVDERVELSCTATGFPQPQFHWFYNDQPLNRTCSRLKLTDRGQKLMIRRVTLEDVGVYSCLIKNEAGEVKRSCTLNIQTHPLAKKPETFAQPDDVRCSPGNDVVISCISSFLSGKGYAYVWLKNGQYLRESRTATYGRELLCNGKIQVKLTISDVNPGDEGKYSLLSMNLFGETRSKEATLDVLQSGGNH